MIARNAVLGAVLVCLVSSFVLGAENPEPSGSREVASYATSGTGAQNDPWTGWERALDGATGVLRFSAGFYATGGATLTVPSGRRSADVVGQGSERTYITVTGDAPALRVRAAGGNPSTILGLEIRDITFRAGAKNSGPLVSLENLDMGWLVSDLYLDTNGQLSAIGLALVDCQNGIVRNLLVRGGSGAAHFGVGVSIDATDANQRGNIHFFGGTISNAEVGIRFTSTRNSLNNCGFFGTKVANSAGTTFGRTGILLNAQADQTGLYSVHVERFAKGIVLEGADGCVVSGALVSGGGIEGASGIDLTDVEGGAILGGRLEDLATGIVFRGVTQNLLVGGLRVSNITGRRFVDATANTRRNSLLDYDEARIGKDTLVLGSKTSKETEIVLEAAGAEGTSAYTSARILSGAGAPAFDAENGSIYLRTDGGKGSTFYVREAGRWSAK